MRFEHPNVLWALLLLAIPIIIHLFQFKRFKLLYFPSLIFVKQVEQETKSVKKLKERLLLLCRLLAFAALIFAFAKPFIPLQPSASNQSKVNAIYIDNSFSMTNLGQDGQLFEIAKEQAKKLINELGDDAQFLIVTNQQSPEEQRLYTKAEALQRVSELTVSPYSRSFGETANWVQTQIDEEGETALKRLVYISDFQRNKNMSDLILDSNVQIFPIQLVAQKSTNIAIDTAWFTNPNFKKGTTNELHVIVHNYSAQAADNLALSLQTNQTQRNVFLDIKANDTAQAIINYTDNQEGWIQGHLSVMDEGIIFDDDLYFSYEVQKQTKVVIIDGEDATPAIQSVFELDPFYNVKSFSSRSIDNEAIKHANTVILNGLNEYSSGLIDVLKAKAKDGSGIGVFLGKSPNIQSVNNLLSQIGLNGIAGKVTEKFKLNHLAEKDLFYRGVFKKIPQNMTFPTQNAHFKIIPSGKSVDLLKFENGDPLLMRSTTFNSFLFAGSLLEGNFLTQRNGLFSTIVLRIGELSRSIKPLYLTIGTSIEYPFMQEQPEVPIKLANKKFEFIPFKTVRQGRSWISVNQIPNNSIISGEYEAIDNKPLGFVSLNYNRAESKLAFNNLDDFTQQLFDKGYKNVTANVMTNNSQIPILKANTAKEYWKLLLILSLVFFLAEMAIIKFWK